MGETSERVVKVFIDEGTGLERYVFRFLFNNLGVDFELTDEAGHGDVVYLESGKTLSCKKDCIQITKDSNHIVWDDLKNNVGDEYHISREIEFDIINAIGFLLTDQGNINRSKNHRDEHGRITYFNSFQYENEIGAIPIVNLYVNHFGRVLESIGVNRQLRFPNAKKACILLSHDVDIPVKHDDLFNFRFQSKKSSGESVFRQFRHLLGLVKGYLGDKNKREFWNFDQIMKSESKYGFKSTSFFASVNNKSNEGHVLDVPYALDKKKFRRIFESMKKGSFEIGLHASYLAHRDVEQFKLEKERLEKHAESRVFGLRHHYWNLGEFPVQTFQMHEAAGFLYDSSLAFNDHIGFRYSSALPFYIFDNLEQKELQVLQIPVFCMDGNFFYDEKTSIEEAIQTLSEYVDTLVEVEGVASIDWHIRTSYPGGSTYRKWGECYLEILNYLSTRDDVWVTSCIDYYNWWKKNNPPTGK